MLSIVMLGVVFFITFLSAVVLDVVMLIFRMAQTIFFSFRYYFPVSAGAGFEPETREY
jgi:hypothetical protein